ncbi:MAG TPA: hypothetical protein VFS42_10795, partial [Burkholderiaceae bacterium]|nr:hypothetical protein [Burkholderiaceae bacterium]
MAPMHEPTPPASPAHASRQTLDFFSRYLDVEHPQTWSVDDLQQQLAVVHPHLAPANQDLTRHVATIDSVTAERLKLARLTIDLVRALLPRGPGNQFKHLSQVGVEPYWRVRHCRDNVSEWAHNGITPYSRTHIHLWANTAIKWEAGNCCEYALVTFSILASLAELREARLEIVQHAQADHQWVMLRGETADQDIVVDPWALFPTPCLRADAASTLGCTHNGTGDGVDASLKVLAVKIPGESWPPLDISAAMTRRGLVSHRDL